MKPEWKQTHLITFQPRPATATGGTWAVMLFEGKFYTEGLWREGGEPEWVLDSDGNARYVAGPWNPHKRPGRVILQELQPQEG